jgi:GNAT superfamily N-acetyltransferase
MDWHRDEYTVSTERSRLDLGVIHRYISEESYWGKGRALEVVRRSVENSLPFGVYRGDELVGFARVVTDRATFAYLADVFVIESYRGRGLSARLMKAVISHPQLQGLSFITPGFTDNHQGTSLT